MKIRIHHRELNLTITDCLIVKLVIFCVHQDHFTAEFAVFVSKFTIIIVHGLELALVTETYVIS